VLDVGSGSGYLSAVLHHIVSPEGHPGKVVGIDHIPELVEWSVQNLKKDGLGSALEKKQIEMITGDGRQGCLSLRFLRSIFRVFLSNVIV
jgi:protein-L-isoaspartate(D-aspartate) O-methyltransferase